MKYHVEINTYSCEPGQYSGNAVEYDSEEEAVSAAKDLFSRWTASKYWRVVDDDGIIINSNDKEEIRQ